MNEPLASPATDPSPIFEHFRGSYATELLAAAIVDFEIFARLELGPQSFDLLAAEAGLERRAAAVLFTALRAMGLLANAPDDRLALTPLAREHLLPGARFDVTGYIGLAAGTPGVREMVARLGSNRPANHKTEEQGTAFIYRAGVESAMERETSARQLTLALAGRARNVAPVLAARVSLADRRCLLDVGGGTGIYSIAWLRQHPQLRAIVWDRPEVLKVAAEMAAEFGVADRLELAPGDMFVDPLPGGVDVCLLSNILHDWDEPECRALVRRCADALPPGGKLLIHDVLLNDAHDGPLPVALYSAALFSITEGRAYSAAEYDRWLTEAGLVLESIQPTLVHCSVLTAVKPAG